MPAISKIRLLPLGSGPEIFRCEGRSVSVIGVGLKLGLSGVRFRSESEKQAQATVDYLREKLASDLPEAKTLREENSFINMMGFIRKVLHCTAWNPEWEE